MHHKPSAHQQTPAVSFRQFKWLDQKDYLSQTRKVPVQFAEVRQLFLKYLCDVCPSLLALTPQGLAPKSGSKPVCRASITPALCLGKGARWPLRRNAGA